MTAAHDASDDAALEAAALPLGEAAPDAEALVVGQRVLEALVAHLAAQADALGLAGRAALLGEERLGVGLRAQRALLPLIVVGSCRRDVVSIGRSGTRLKWGRAGAPNRRRPGIGVRVLPTEPSIRLSNRIG